MYILSLSSSAFCLHFLHQGGDKLTLSLNNTLGKASSEANNVPTSSKLINLDPPGENASEQLPSDNCSTAAVTPICVTHFSRALNGVGVERETIFSDAIFNGRGGEDKGKNPFLDDGAEDETNSNNPFKYATIGRSNPFTKNNTNPFLAGDDNKENGAADIKSSDPNAILTPLIQAEEDKKHEEKADNVVERKLNKIVSILSSACMLNVCIKCSARMLFVMLCCWDFLHVANSFLAIANVCSSQETSFASNQPVTRSLSSAGPHHSTRSNKSTAASSSSKIPVFFNNSDNKSFSRNNRLNSSGGSGRNRQILKADAKNSSLEDISPWLVSSEAIASKKEKEKSKIPQLRTVITTEL